MLKKKTILFLLLGAIGFMLIRPDHVMATIGQWGVNGANMYYTDGYVGIGTSAPLERFQVQGVNESIGIGGSLSTGKATGLQFLSMGVQNAGLRWSNDSTKNLYLEDASNSVNPSTWNIAGNQVNLVVSNGNVGIGRANVPNALHVARDGTINLEGLTSGTSVLQFYPKGYSGGRYGWEGFGSLTDNHFYISNVYGGIVLQPNNPSTVYVQGSLRANEVDVMSNIWADYVFNKTYKLMPLPDLEKYIQTYKHLPNIPTEKEVKDKGISIGEMQSKEMSKIEELTLYMIKEDKKINDLEEQNKLLKEEIALLKNQK